MRAVLALVCVLAAGGCSAAGLHTFANNVDVLFGGDSEESAPPPIPSDTKCRDLALDRSSDVADQGFDDNVRREVFATTYSDCVAWAARGTTLTAK